MTSGDNIGMMEGAFFVSKGVILDWMNELLDVSNTISIPFNQSLFQIVVVINQDRVMCNRCSLCPDIGCHLPWIFQFS